MEYSLDDKTSHQTREPIKSVRNQSDRVFVDRIPELFPTLFLVEFSVDTKFFLNAKKIFV